MNDAVNQETRTEEIEDVKDENDVKNERDERPVKISKETVDGIEEFIECAKRTILPYNELAFRTIVNVVELTLIRGEFGDVAGGYRSTTTPISEQEAEAVDVVVKDVITSGVLDDIEIIEKAKRGLDA